MTRLRMPRSVLGRAVRWTAVYLAGGLVSALIALPLVAEQAVERVSFEDAVGTFPVEMSLCRKGRSTLRTGVFGDVHWEEPGPWRFGIQAQVTGPPVGGGTLASYVDRRLIQANVELIENPDAAVRAYVAEFRARILDQILTGTAVAALVGGLLGLAVWRNVRVEGRSRRRHVVVAGALVGALAAASGGAVLLFQRWPCNAEPEPAHALPALPQLTFSSPQTREIAQQVRPFIEKNRVRIEQRAREYEAAAVTSFARALSRRGAALAPREGEVVVSAEADPQGAYVGIAVRRELYQQLRDHLGADALALRTISGDITSNGTVAEDDFVSREAAVAGDLPTVAVAGDHDSEQTWAQMREHGMTVPELSTEEVAGLRVSGANDVEHKALFGQIVTNESGISERELGARLREAVAAPDTGIVLLHQPEAAAGYLGLSRLDELAELRPSPTQPSDDGVPDVPPGTVNVGHLHDLDGPWVLWNTDGEEVTWTVVDQLGTTGGVEESSTFNRFSTPVSVPLKPLAWRLQYVDLETGLQTGYATVSCDVEGRCGISPRTDVGLPLPAR